MKKALIIIVLTLFVFSCKKEVEIQKEVEPLTVKIKKIKSKSFIEYGEYYGKVAGISEAQLISVIGGRVESVKVKEGTRVKAGASLANIDSNKVINQYDTAVLNEKISIKHFERQKKFLETGNASEVSVDQAELQWLNSKTSLREAEKIREGNLCITPISGIVVSRFIDPYQEISAGTLAFIVADLTRLKITIGIPENDMAGIKEHNKADVSFSIFPDRVWKGSLTRYSRKSFTDNLTFQAEVVINNYDLSILSGTTAEVKLVRKKYFNKVVIPTNKILFIGEKTFVMVYVDGIAKQLEVTTGASDNKNTLILKGLKFGDLLITEGFNIVENDAPVVLAEEIDNKEIQ